MLKKIGLIAFNIIIFIILTLFLLKLIAYLPANKLQPLLADKIIFLQNAERNLEKFMDKVKATYQQVSLSKAEERKYKNLYQQLLTEKNINNALLYENKTLRNKLGFVKNYDYALVSAEIISRGADNWFNFIIVNRGAQDGIKKDMEVVNEQGLLGYAYLVFPESTKVILLTDPLFQVSCINQRTSEIGILSGQLDKPMQLNYIASNSEVQSGDLLLTSGHSLRFRRGIPIASVVKVSSVRNNYYKNVSAEPLVDFSKLDFVYFIK